MKKILKFIELSKWFNRKSQHYILGNWTCYISWFKALDSFRLNKKLFNYYKQYPLAYLKFMWLSREDFT